METEMKRFERCAAVGVILWPLIWTAFLVGCSQDAHARDDRTRITDTRGYTRGYVAPKGDGRWAVTDTRGYTHGYLSSPSTRSDARGKTRELFPSYGDSDDE